MSINFRTKNLILTSQTVTASGNSIYVNGVELIAAVSGNLIQTGVIIEGQINSLSGWAASALNLQTTGSNIYTLLINESGALLNVIANTGSQAWNAANNNAINLSGNLALTGSNLYTLVVNESGAILNTVALTGQGAINFAIAGDTNISGSVTQTGVALINRDLIISGTLATGIAQTGSNAVNHANGIGTIISGNLTQSGINILAINLATSGVLYTGIATTGSNLYNFIIGLSGALNSSGQYIESQINSLSGWSAPALANYFYRTGTQTVTGNTTIQGNLTVISGQYQPINTVVSNYSVLLTDNRLYCNNTSTITLTLPSAATASGQLIDLKLINTGIVILTGTFTQKIDGSDSYVIVGQYQTRELHAGGVNWYVW